MNRSRCYSFLACSALLALAAPADAQRPFLSAREAIGLVSAQFGPQSVEWLAELRAQGGVPQPSDWQVLSYDARAPRLLYRFWAGGGRAGDGGIDEQRYPDDVPFGYFRTSQIGVDSIAAFTIAEGEARKAKMAFDSCDYLLRLREYSNEPVWRLELLDTTRRLVGKLYISAGNGEVLRTVWIYRDQRARPDGLPLIVDSMAPGGAGATMNLSGFDAPATAVPEIGAAPAPSVSGQVPGSMMGIHSVPLPPTPGAPVAGNGSFVPVDPAGRPALTPVPPAASAPPSDSIPAPPPLSQAPAAPAIPPPPAPSIPAVPAPPAAAPAPAPAVTKPPVKPSAGDSERIPPPPIPR